MRMILPTGALSVLLLAVGVLAAWYTHELQKDTAELFAVNVASVRAAEEFEIAMREIRVQVIQFVLTGDRKHLENVPRLREQTDHWLAEAERVATTAREQRWMERVRAGYGQFFQEFDELAGPPPEARPGPDRMKRIDDILIREILSPAHEYLDYNEDVIVATGEASKQLTARMALVLLLLGTCGAVAGLLAGVAIALGIVRSFVQINHPLRDVAGKLSPVVGPIALAELSGPGELEHALRVLSNHVSTVIAQLRQRHQEVLRADQLAAAGQLAAGMAHEVRNPLTSMKMLVQAAAERGDAARIVGRDLQVLQEEITRMEKSIQAFLDFARAPQLEKRRAYLPGLVQQVLRLVSSRAESQGVQLICSWPDGSDPIEVDPDQIRQVVINLLLNALDALPYGGTIWIHVERRAGEVSEPPPEGASPASAGLAWMAIRVADSGPGLPKELGEQVFEPFVSTKEAGVGLGLAICRRIAQAHGGQIRAAERPGGGAEFSVLLPLTGVGAAAATLEEAGALA
jgi:signal transduction histidine kinase